MMAPGYKFTEKALQDVADERGRQVNEEGYQRSHDDAHKDGALALAAAAYIGHSIKDLGQYGPPDGQDDDVAVLISMAPWSIRAKAPRDSLVKAAALLVAEIERRDRLRGRAS